MTVQRATTGGGIELAYETFGDPADPPLLLVMGLGTQMLAWPDEFCDALAGQGFFVVRYDNRDVGLSTHLHDAPTPSPLAVMGGDLSSVAYRLTDMAADAAGLLDALQLQDAHVVGASMGGMIAQTLAIEHPDRVRSLTSIMSTTGDRAVGHATQAAAEVLMSAPATTREEAIERSVRNARVTSSPGFPFDEAGIRERAALAFDRGHDPVGVGRQLAAIFASPDRTPALQQLDVPTLVVHGADDPLVDRSGGEATAAAVPGAELAVFDGMGHDLPKPLLPELARRIGEHAARADARAADPA